MRKDFIKKELTQKTRLRITRKSYRSMFATLMKKSKQKYFENKLKGLKSTRKGIKSVIYMKSSSSNYGTLLTYQKENIDNPERFQ